MEGGGANCVCECVCVTGIEKHWRAMTGVPEDGIRGRQ